MPDEPNPSDFFRLLAPAVGDLFTRDYVSFYRVQHLDDLSSQIADRRGAPLSTPQAVINIAPGGDWRKAVTSYIASPENASVLVWDANTPVPTSVSVTV